MINRLGASVLAAGLLAAGLGAASVTAAHPTSDPVEPVSFTLPLLGPAAFTQEARPALPPLFKQNTKDGCTVREQNADDVGVYCDSNGHDENKFQAVTSCANGHYAFSPWTSTGFTAYASCKETQSSTVLQPPTWIVKRGGDSSGNS
jgi:hypothetical protein